MQMTAFFHGNLKPVAISLLSMSLLACGGGGGGGGEKNDSSAAQDRNAPSVSVRSPKYNQATTNHSVLVTGTASDTQSGVASVEVNGIEASSEDDYATWQVYLPLTSTLSNLDVSAEDRAGNRRELNHAVKVNRVADRLSQVDLLSIDAANKRLLITDKTLNSLFAADLENPQTTAVQLRLEENDLELNFPSGFFWNPNAEALLYLDFTSSSTESSQALFSANLSSGMVTALHEIVAEDSPLRFYEMVASEDMGSVFLLSAPVSSTASVIRRYNLSTQTLSDIATTTAHSNPDFGPPSCLTAADGQQALYLIDNNAVVSVDLRTGQLSTRSPRTSPIPFASPIDMAVGTQANRAWISDYLLNAIVEVNLSTGARRILSDTSHGLGPDFNAVGSVVFDAESNRLLVADTETKRVLSVDTETGNREYFLDNGFGTGEALAAPYFIKVAADGSTAYVTDAELKAVVAVDLANGARTVISKGANSSGSAVGLGGDLHAPSNIALNGNADTLWITDLDSSNIIQIDIASGERSTLELAYASGSKVIQKPTGIAFDSRTQSLLVTDLFNDSAQTIPLNSRSVAMTGARQMNDGSTLEKPVSVTLDNNTNRIYAVDSVRKGLVEWQPANGGAKILSTLFVGQGIDFAMPIDVSVNPAEQKAYVSDEELNAVLEVDLTTGDREVVSGLNVGSGPMFRQISGLDYHRSSNTLYVVDRMDRSVYAINPANGNRRAVTR